MKKGEILFIFGSIIFISFCVYVFISADQNILPDFIKNLYRFSGGDKVGHFLLMGILNFAICLLYVLLKKDSKNVTIVKITILVAIAITFEEISQKYFSSRTFSLIDLLASYIGIFFTGLIYYCYKKRRETKI